MIKMKLLAAALILINSLTSAVYASEIQSPSISECQQSTSEQQPHEIIAETIESIYEKIQKSSTWKSDLSPDQLMTLVNISLYSGLPFDYNICYNNLVKSDKEEVMALIYWFRENKNSIDYRIISSLYYDALNDGALLNLLICEFSSDLKKNTPRGQLIEMVISVIKSKYVWFPGALEIVTDSEENMKELYKIGTDVNTDGDQPRQGAGARTHD